MRVLCINPNGWYSSITRKRTDRPAYMEECIAIGEEIENGRKGYILEGYGTEPHYVGNFILLSEEPELEKVKEEVECV